MRFSFPHSHAFRGGRVTVEDEGVLGPDCLIAFGDGVTVIAACHRGGEAIHLAVPAYCTAKGTEVAARNWRLVRRKDGVWRSEREA